MVTRVLSYTLPSATPIKMGVSRDNGLTPLDPMSVGFLLPCSIRINKQAPIDPVPQYPGHQWSSKEDLGMQSQWLVSAVVVGLKKRGILRN